MRRTGEVEGDLEARRRELRLRRAVQIAKQGRLAPEGPGAQAAIHRASVRAQRAILWHALRTGEVKQARRAGRILRVSDFAGEPGAVEALLGVIRDARSADIEILDAAARLARFRPAPC